MEETRIEKYKKYRDSIIKEDAITLETSNDKTFIKERKKPSDTTSFLPIEEVYDATNQIEEQKRLEKKSKNKKILKYVLIVGGLLIVVALLVVIGIVIWRK